MTTDRELLELAAKAEGVDGNYFENDNPIHRGIYQARGEFYWNPLISDSEVFRLAVKLGIGQRYHIGFGEVFHPCIGIEDFPYDGDPLSATRRAIVRAAARIGENMS